MSDRLTRWLAYAAFVLVLAILTLAFYVVWTGVLRPHPPRTYLERDLQRLESVVESKPELSDGWRDYLRALTAAGQFAKAHRVADEARSVVPSDTPTIDIEEARTYTAEGDTDAALSTLDAAIAALEGSMDAEIAAMAARGVKADRAYLLSSDTLISAYILKAQVFSSVERWGEAAETYSQALELEPAMADVLVARGFVYIRLDDTAKAEKDFNRALEFDPELETAKAGLKEIEQ